MMMMPINDDDNDNQCIAMITMTTINLSKSGEHDPCVSQVHPSLHETRFELNSNFFLRVGFFKSFHLQESVVRSFASLGLRHVLRHKAKTSSSFRHLVSF